MSAIESLRAPVRSEIDVAAETIARLVHENVLGSGRIPDAERAAGLMPGEVRAAMDVLNRRGWLAPSRREASAVAEAVATELARSRHVKLHEVRARRSPGFAAKNPAPGLRRCSICVEVLPVAAFSIKDQRTGQLKSACSACVQLYQRARYMSCDARRSIESAGLELSTDEAGLLAGLRCTHCGRPLGTGEVRSTIDVVGFHHARCAEPAK